MRAKTWLPAVVAAIGLSCGGGGSLIDDPTPGNSVVTSVSVTGASLILVDKSVQLVAAAANATGGIVSGVSFAWVSDNPTVVSVDGSGLVTGKGPGSASITATPVGSSVSGRVQLAVKNEIVAGTTTLYDGALTVVTPAGAVPPGVTLNVAPTSIGSPDSRVLGNAAYDFGPDGTQFATPVTVAIKFDAAGLSAADIAGLSLGLLSGGVWTPVANSTVNAASGTVSAPVSHFSSYSVMRRGDATKLIVAAGDNQSTAPGVQVSVAPKVRVLDSKDRPVAGVTVTYRVTSGGGSITGSSVVSDFDGVAAVASWVLGPSAGANTLEASVTGLSVVTFAATGVVAAGPVIGLSPGSVAFAGQAGAANPAAKNVTVTNAGAQTLTGLSVATITYSGGSTGWLAATLNSSTAPTTLVLTPNITGVPQGNYSATVTVQSSLSGVASQSVSVTLALSGALTATQAVASTPAIVNVAVPSFIPVTASGGTAPYTFALTGGTLPSGMSFNTSTGAVSGTPGSALATTTFTVTVTDAVSATASNTFSLTVTPAGTPLSTTQAVPVKVGTVNTLIPTFTPVTPSGGTPAYAYALSGGALPTGMSFSTTTGAVSGTPTSVLAATVFTVTVTDAASATSAKTFTLTVNAALTTSQAVQNTTGIVNTVIASFIPVVASGGTTPYTYALSGGTLPTGVSFNTATGAVSGTPTVTLAATTFTVTVTDAVLATSSKTFSLTVNSGQTPVGTVAIATSSQIVAMGSFLSYSATIRDANGNFLFGRTVTWSSSTPSVATVSQSGFVTTVSRGTTTITATCEGVTASQAIWVVTLPVTISVFAGNNQSATVGTQLPIAPSVKVSDADGNPLVGFMIFMPVSTGGGSVTGNLVATNASGVAAVGSWTLGTTAGSNELLGASYAVSGLNIAHILATGTPGPAVSMSVSPLDPLIAVGATQQLTATPRDAYSNPITATVAWSSSSPSVASVGAATGLVTANAVGDATMTATYGVLTGTTVVHVGAASIYDGNWSGTTSAGNGMGFLVQLGRITSFSLGVGVSTNGCYVSVNTSPYSNVSGGTLSVSWPGGTVSASASGTFSSATAASGGYSSVTLSSYFCYPSTLVSGTTGGGSWTASKQ